MNGHGPECSKWQTISLIGAAAVGDDDSISASLQFKLTPSLHCYVAQTLKKRIQKI